MSWIGLLLVGLGLADLLHSVRPVRLLPEVGAAVVTVVLGLFAGLTGAVDVAALVIIATVTVAWGRTVTRGFGRGPAWVPLLVAGSALVLTIALSGLAGPAEGLLDRWLGDVALPLLSAVPADRFLLLLGVVLVQLSTGNVVVRLVLTATGTINPARDAMSQPERRLKGGRLLGPMERVLILGLGLAGQVTAAGLVVAAKGLLRFPELSSKLEQERVHRLTEYFLVGSFVSWLLALGGVALLA
jgi:hypothetical protein